jgi:hypothetical protein
MKRKVHWFCKLSGHEIEIGNATKWASACPDGPLRVPCDPPVPLLAPGRCTPRLPRSYRRVAPPHQFAAPSAHGALKAYVANVCVKCFKYFKGMLQVFYMDVAYVAMTIQVCCNCLFKMFHLF